VRLLIRPALREQGGKTGIVYLKRGFHKTLWTDRQLTAFQNSRVLWCQALETRSEVMFVPRQFPPARPKNFLPRTRTTLHRFDIHKYDLAAVSKSVRWNFIHNDRIRGIARPPSYEISNTYMFSWTGGDVKKGYKFFNWTTS
jgi:hypothetical protein